MTSFGSVHPEIREPQRHRDTEEKQEKPTKAQRTEKEF
jgi:hypothetical protein